MMLYYLRGADYKHKIIQFVLNSRTITVRNRIKKRSFFHRLQDYTTIRIGFHTCIVSMFHLKKKKNYANIYIAKPIINVFLFK